MIGSDGWQSHSVWEHSQQVRDLYDRRCRQLAPEMTCHAQAAELLAPWVSPGDTLLDVGCGSGYFFHSLQARNLPVTYFGMDASLTLLEIGRRILPEYGLDAHRLRHMRLDDLSGEADHVVCMNVLTNLDNFQRPLERMLQCSQKTLLLRESMGEESSYLYVHDEYLDPGYRLRVHVNTYDLSEVAEFIESFNFSAEIVIDRHSGGRPESVIGYPHHWTFVMARRR